MILCCYPLHRFGDVLLLDEAGIEVTTSEPGIPEHCLMEDEVGLNPHDDILIEGPLHPGYCLFAVLAMGDLEIKES